MTRIEAYVAPHYHHQEHPEPLVAQEVEIPEYVAPVATEIMVVAPQELRPIKEQLATLEAVGASETIMTLARELYAHTQEAILPYSQGLSPDYCTVQKLTEESIEALGMLTLLVQQNPKQADVLFQKTTASDVAKKIKYIVIPTMDPFGEILSFLRDDRYEGLQTADERIHTHLPNATAKLLLNKDGTVNFGIVPTLQRHLKLVIGDDDETLNDASLLQGVEELARAPTFREKIHALSADTLHDKGHFLVRTTCNLDPNERINDQHVREAVLTGLLSRLRQGGIGSCFATSVGIGLMVWDLQHVADDLQELLEKGHLTRKVKGEELSFPFHLKMPNDTCGDWITLDEDGSYKGKHLSEDCAIRAACCAVGIPPSAHRRMIDDWLEERSGNSVKPVECLRAVLKQQMRDIGIAKQQAKPLLERMIFAYEGQVRSPLLRCWEQSLAAMGEVTDFEGHSYTALVKQSIAYTLVDYLPVDILFDDQLADQVVDTYLNVLDQHVRMLYDPSINRGTVASDGHSTNGGWVLYDPRCTQDSEEWKRIDTTRDFAKLLKRSVKHLFERLNQEMPEQDSLLYDAEKTLSSVLNSKAFAEDVEATFSNIFPWGGNCRRPGDGGFSAPVFQVYYEMAAPPEVVKMQPQSASHLLNRILRLIKSSPKEVQEKYRSSPHLLAHAGNRFHEFSLTLGHPTMVKAWTDSRYSRQWIEEELMEPGRKMGQKAIDDTLRAAVLKEAKKDVPESRHEELKAALDKIGEGEELWRCDYRNRLISTLQKFDEKLPIRKVDAFLVRNLPEEDLEELKQSMVHIADSNWHNDHHDIRYVIGFNPFSYQLEMWYMDDGEKLRVADQVDWVLDNEWEFFAQGVGTLVPGVV